MKFALPQYDWNSRCDTMLVLSLYLVASATIAWAQTFAITQIIVPEVVPPGQTEVDIECQTYSNFTILNWFKGPFEIFRYKPMTTRKIWSFPISGISTVELISCGPTGCRVRLGGLTEDATGLYRCDIERDLPPYMFDTKTSFMNVHRENDKTPILEGLAEEYGENDMIKAFCRATPETEIRWYINDHEIKEMRGSSTFNRKSARNMFVGLPPRVTVQCAEFRYGKMSGSKEFKPKWHEDKRIEKNATKFAINESSGKLDLCKFILLFFSLCLLKVFMYM